MAWNFRRTLWTLLRKVGQAAVVVLYAAVTIIVAETAESYFVSDHFPFNALKFCVGVVLVLGALPVLYLINGREIGQDSNLGIWSLVLGGLFAFSFIIGILSLTYWSQYTDNEYYTWTTLGIYAIGMFGMVYRQYRS